MQFSEKKRTTNELKLAHSPRWRHRENSVSLHLELWNSRALPKSKRPTQSAIANRDNVAPQSVHSKALKPHHSLIICGSISVTSESDSYKKNHLTTMPLHLRTNNHETYFHTFVMAGEGNEKETHLARKVGCLSCGIMDGILKTTCYKFKGLENTQWEKWATFIPVPCVSALPRFPLPSDPPSCQASSKKEAAFPPQIHKQ